MAPVIGGAKALRRDRLSHVDQTYLRLATYKAANAPSSTPRPASACRGCWKSSRLTCGSTRAPATW
uniref:hypothetical protein n=1 Tax=Streptosporangium album TaxID=47479 RepID=UPI0035E445F8